jgi:protein-arginine kinase activator protein McsA
MGKAAALFVIAFAAVMGMPSAAAQNPTNTCFDCHSLLEDDLGVTSEAWQSDIHMQKGLTCANCHGGAPTTDDDRSMSKAAGFRGKMTRKQVVEMCASCHSDAAKMRAYNPSLRTDQLNLYKASIHGKLLFARNDAKVAVCTDCHGVHGIRPAGDTRSRVHPLNIAATCAGCHAKPDYMRPYGIPTDQFDAYQQSVHHEALTERGDLSAPTCTTCHGNHGAAPPGVAAIENVCSTCHVFQAQLFDTSRHKQAWAAADLAPCTTCHSNHRVQRPSDLMIGVGPKSVCRDCHSEGDPGYLEAGVIQSRLLALQTSVHGAEELLHRAERSGMEVSQALLDLSQARDSLTKARVSIHSFDANRVEQDITPGLKIAQGSHERGIAAMKERDFRRVGLGISVVLVIFVLFGLRLFIKSLEA